MQAAVQSFNLGIRKRKLFIPVFQKKCGLRVWPLMTKAARHGHHHTALNKNLATASGKNEPEVKLKAVIQEAPWRGLGALLSQSRG